MTKGIKMKQNKIKTKRKKNQQPPSTSNLKLLEREREREENFHESFDGALVYQPNHPKTLASLHKYLPLHLEQVLGSKEKEKMRSSQALEIS